MFELLPVFSNPLPPAKSSHLGKVSGRGGMGSWLGSVTNRSCYSRRCSGPFLAEVVWRHPLDREKKSGRDPP